MRAGQTWWSGLGIVGEFVGFLNLMKGGGSLVSIPIYRSSLLRISALIHSGDVIERWEVEEEGGQGDDCEEVRRAEADTK